MAVFLFAYKTQSFFSQDLDRAAPGMYNYKKDQPGSTEGRPTTLSGGSIWKSKSNGSEF